MTREERINSAKVLRNFDLNNLKVNSLLFSTEEITSAFDMAIKALEQESILDNLKAEIERMDFDFGDFYDHTDAIVEKLLQVIDKYIEESKETEE